MIFLRHNHPWIDNNELLQSLYESCCRRAEILGKEVIAVHKLLQTPEGQAVEMCSVGATIGTKSLIVTSGSRMLVCWWSENFPMEEYSTLHVREVQWSEEMGDWWGEARKGLLHHVPMDYRRYEDNRDEGYVISMRMEPVRDEDRRPTGGLQVDLEGMPRIDRDQWSMIGQVLILLREDLDMPGVDPDIWPDEGGV